jgi:hypothetical protein
MSLKLSRLKKWLTLEDAAKFLSLLISEEITTAGLLQVALQGDLTLSINLVNRHYALLGPKVSLQDARLFKISVKESMTPGASPEIKKSDELQGPEKNVFLDALMGKTLQNYYSASDSTEEYGQITSKLSKSAAGQSKADFVIYFEGDALPDYSGVLEFDRKIVHKITGIWDLPMVGSETLEIEDAFYSEIDGPEIDRMKLCGVMLKHPTANQWANLCQRFTSTSKGENPQDFYPCGELPEREPIVIRRDELQRFAESLNESENISSTDTAHQEHPPHLSELPHKFQQLYGAIAGGELPDLEAAINAWYLHWNQRAARGERDTYPANPHVQAWLEDRGLTKNKAESIPPLIRPKWG